MCLYLSKVWQPLSGKDMMLRYSPTIKCCNVFWAGGDLCRVWQVLSMGGSSGGFCGRHFLQVPLLAGGQTIRGRPSGRNCGSVAHCLRCHTLHLCSLSCYVVCRLMVLCVTYFSSSSFLFISSSFPFFLFIFHFKSSDSHYFHRFSSLFFFSSRSLMFL